MELELEIVVETIDEDGYEAAETYNLKGEPGECLALAIGLKDECIDMYLNNVPADLSQLHFLNEVMKP
jgi:hypothetical protein